MMARRLKRRICKVIAISFQSCRSKHPSTLPSINPFPSLSLRLSTTTKPHTQPSSEPGHFSTSFRHHMSSALTSVGCGNFRSRSTTLSDDDDRSRSPVPPPDFKWNREDEWHVMAKVHNDHDDLDPPRQTCNSAFFADCSDCEDDDKSHGLAPPPTPPPPPPPPMVKRRVKSHKPTSRLRISSSSVESNLSSSDEGGFETETLVSSASRISFSTDSSSLHYTRQRKKKKKKIVKKVKKLKRCVSVTTTSPESGESPARLSVFQRLIPWRVDGKVRESYAVVKKSEDPYEDFKRSMVEMILEKEMFDEKELEQLLHCFLSLNGKQHHGVILEAFSEIWETLLFYARRRSSSASTRDAR